MEAYDFLRSEWLISFMLPYILVLYCSTGQMRVFHATFVLKQYRKQTCSSIILRIACSLYLLNIRISVGSKQMVL